MTSFAEALKARQPQTKQMTDVEVKKPQTVADPVTYQQALQVRHPSIQQQKVGQPSTLAEMRDVVTGELRETEQTKKLPEFSLEMEAYAKDPLGSIKTTAGLLFAADDEGKKEVLRKWNPDIKIDTDEKGNDIITMPDGEQAVLNDPGLSKNDFLQLAFDTAWFAGPGKVAAIGKTAAAKAGLGAAGAAGAEAARQQISGELGTGEEFDPTRIGLAGMAGAAAEYIPAKVREGLAGRAQKRAGVVAEDIAGVEQKVARAAELTEETGIPLFRAQQTGNLTDQGRQAYVASLPSASSKAAKALEAQNKAAYDAVLDTMDKIAPVENIEIAAKGIRKAAKGVIGRKERVRSTAAGRYYKEAFTDKSPVELNKTFAAIDKVKGQFEPASKTTKLMERVESLLGKGAEKAGDIQKRHNSKKEIDDIFKEFGDSAAARTGKKELTKVKKIMIKELRDANPNYDEARKIFAQLSPSVQKITEGKVGQLAALDENQLKTVASKLFDATQQAVDPASVRRAKKLISDYDPDAWSDIVRTEFQRRLGKTGVEGAEVTAMENIPGQLYNKLFKGENGKTLYAALDGDAAKNARYLEEALKRASKGRPGGSQTGERRVFEKELGGRGIFKGIKKLVTRPAETIGEIGEDIAFDRNARALSEVMFDPKWSQDMAALRRMNPNSQAAERKITSLIKRAAKTLKPAVVSQAPESPAATRKAIEILDKEE